MNMIGHKYVSQDNEVVEFGSFVYSPGQEFADLVLLKIWLAIEGRECELVRISRIVPGFSSLMLDLPFAHVMSFTLRNLHRRATSVGRVSILKKESLVWHR